MSHNHLEILSYGGLPKGMSKNNLMMKLVILEIPL
jgi:hypothetical protein